MLETLRRIDHRRYLFGIKRSTEANSWSWQKVFPSGNPKRGVRLLNILYVHGILPNGETERKGTVASTYIFFLSLSLSFSHSFLLSFFVYFFLSSSLFLSFLSSSQYDPRTTQHQTTDLPVHCHTAQHDLALLLIDTVPSDCKWHAFIPFHVAWSCH